MGNSTSQPVSNLSDEFLEEVNEQVQKIENSKNEEFNRQKEVDEENRQKIEAIDNKFEMERQKRLDILRAFRKQMDESEIVDKFISHIQKQLLENPQKVATYVANNGIGSNNRVLLSSFKQNATYSPSHLGVYGYPIFKLDEIEVHGRKHINTVQVDDITLYLKKKFPKNGEIGLADEGKYKGCKLYVSYYSTTTFLIFGWHEVFEIWMDLPTK